MIEIFTNNYFCFFLQLIHIKQVHQTMIFYEAAIPLVNWIFST